MTERRQEGIVLKCGNITGTERMGECEGMKKNTEETEKGKKNEKKK
jgi:hypothetical protein